MSVYHQVLKTAYRKVGRFFMPREKCPEITEVTSGNKSKPQDRTNANADNARSHICHVRNQTIACQSLSAG